MEEEGDGDDDGAGGDYMTQDQELTPLPAQSSFRLQRSGKGSAGAVLAPETPDPPARSAVLAAETPVQPTQMDSPSPVVARPEVARGGAGSSQASRASQSSSRASAGASSSQASRASQSSSRASSSQASRASQSSSRASSARVSINESNGTEFVETDTASHTASQSQSLSGYDDSDDNTPVVANLSGRHRSSQTRSPATAESLPAQYWRQRTAPLKDSFVKDANGLVRKDAEGKPFQTWTLGAGLPYPRDKPLQPSAGTAGERLRWTATESYFVRMWHETEIVPKWEHKPIEGWKKLQREIIQANYASSHYYKGVFGTTHQGFQALKDHAKDFGKRCDWAGTTSPEGIAFRKKESDDELRRQEGIWKQRADEKEKARQRKKARISAGRAENEAGTVGKKPPNNPYGADWVSRAAAAGSKAHAKSTRRPNEAGKGSAPPRSQEY